VTTPIELRGPTITVREFRAADRAMFRSLLADPRLYEFGGAPRSSAKSDAYLDWIISNRADTSRSVYNLAIEANAGFAGWCTLTVEGGDAPWGVVGWEIAPESWGQGLATDATNLLVDFALHHLGFQRVEALTHVANGRAIRVLEKCGFVVSARSDPDELLYVRCT
jgi:RimJ/RimL family protein N-acetyltransferase